mmetsp:Transcript_17727/g.41591  ORF Transcript_17727/g.41591 Transcript_17727/m.41591 type:complete len:537 (-) Transcript_17727:129-1739(-)
MADEADPLNDDGEEGEEEEEEEQIDVEALAPDLLAACKADDNTAANDLLEKGVPPTSSEGGWGCLHWASINGNVELLTRLVDAGAVSVYKQAKLQAAESSFDAEGMGEGGPDYTVVAPKLVMNTPLHWAAFKGHQRIVWLLLQAGYAPNDVDEVGNTALHLAAANSHIASVRTLLDSGAVPHVRNAFQNRPVDLATSEAVRTVFKKAAGESVMTPAELDAMHEKNVERYILTEQSLKDAIDGKSGSEDSAEAQLQTLEDAIMQAEGASVSPSLVAAGHDAVKRLLIDQELTEQIELVQSHEPIITQKLYTTHVNKLARLLRKGRSMDVSAHLIEDGEYLKRKSHSEYWLKMACNKMGPVACATEEHIPHIDKLERAIAAAEEEHAQTELVAFGKTLLSKLQAELEISRAVESVPIVKLPIEEPPKDYWDLEQDVGHIEETEEFPLPPAESEVYIWVPSPSLKSVRASYERLAAAQKGGESGGADGAIVEMAKSKLSAVEKDLKQLEAKDAEDKAVAVAAAEKLAKKLKKKGGKKKK